MNFKQRLFYSLQGSLPGWRAQCIMAPYERTPKSLYPPTRSEQHFQAAVLICFSSFKEDDAEVFMIKRTSGNGPHAGQMAFPGGKKDDHKDKNLKETALREFHEETGIDDPVTIIGNLSPVYIPVSRYYVTPFVGFLEHFIKHSINHDEVENLYTIPFSFFLNPDHCSERTITENRKAPGWFYKNEFIWGASAMMLSELCTIIDENGFMNGINP